MNTYHMGTKCVREDIHLEMESRDRFRSFSLRHSNTIQVKIWENYLTGGIWIFLHPSAESD